ncbi:MAG: DUF4974 domain-containing protein [Prevotella sp.]|nr:DUF4974 domain-containing protein [Prevotella sp.]
MKSEDHLSQILEQMYAQPEADTSEIIDEEWQQFEARYFAPRRHSWGWMQIAASIVGIIMFSGIAYAAFQYVTNHLQASSQQQAQEPPQTGYRLSTTSPDTQDSVKTTEPKVFENVPLRSIAEELGRNYHLPVKVRNEEAAALRLYYPWNPQMSLEKVIGELNRFDKVKLTVENHSIIIE